MSQKLENLLNLALDADQGERERSEELDPSSCNEVDFLFHLIHQSSTLQNIFMRDIILCIGFTVQCDAVNVPVSYTHLDVYKRQLKW